MAKKVEYNGYQGYEWVNHSCIAMQCNIIHINHLLAIKRQIHRRQKLHQLW